MLLAFAARLGPAFQYPAARRQMDGATAGNGRLGAMVFGGVVSERIQLNEDRVWAGEKRDAKPARGGGASSNSHAAFRTRIEEAEELAGKTMFSMTLRPA